jgi:hypothetical protein
VLRSRLRLRTAGFRGHVEETSANFDDVAARPLLVDIR